SCSAAISLFSSVCMVSAEKHLRHCEESMTRLSHFCDRSTELCICLKLDFDQPRSLGRDRFRQRLVEVVGGGDRAALDAHTLGERDEVDGRPVDLEHVLGALAGLAGADAVELAAQD